MILSEEPLFTIRKPLFFLLRDHVSGAFRSVEHAFAEKRLVQYSKARTTQGRQLLTASTAYSSPSLAASTVANSLVQRTFDH